jgi:hypothetical protein
VDAAGNSSPAPDFNFLYTVEAAEGGSCKEGSIIGPATGTCSDWHYNNRRGKQNLIETKKNYDAVLVINCALLEIGLIIVAAIIIGVFGLMLVNNIISAIKMDLRTAKLLVNDDEIGAEFLKTSWWREERSNKAWVRILALLQVSDVFC